MNTNTLLDSTREALALPYIKILLIIIVLLLVYKVAHSFVTQLIRRTVRSHKFETKHEEQQREDTLVSVFDTATLVILWVVAIILILQALGVNIAALATGAGLVGIIVGFGAQSIIKDFSKGFFIILENQYRVGDIVTLNNFSGVVELLTIRITRLRDLDGNTHVIPNGDISAVTNMTFGHSNVNINVGVSYDADIEKVEQVINKTGIAMAGEDVWKSIILEPIQFLRVDNFADSAVVIKSLGKVAPSMQWKVAGEFRRRIKKAFESAGIEIPYQQVVIHQRKNSK